MRPWLIVLLLASLSVAFAADVPAPAFAPVTRTHATVTGQPIVTPAQPEVVVSEVTFPPGARTSVHKHPYPRLVYVLQGALIVTNVETGKSYPAKAGDFLAEMQNTWHYGTNAGTVPAKLLVIDEVPHGTANNVVEKK